MMSPYQLFVFSTNAPTLPTRETTHSSHGKGSWIFASIMSLTTQSAKRRGSYLELASNPLEGASPLNDSVFVENLSDTVKIERVDLDFLISSLESIM